MILHKSLSRAKSLPSSTEFRWLRSAFDPIQKQAQDVDSSVHVPVPQYTTTFCVSTQSYTVALRSVIFAASLCRQPCISQLAATQYCIWKHHSTMMRLCRSGILLLVSVQNSYLVAAVWCQAMLTGFQMCRLPAHDVSTCQWSQLSIGRMVASAWGRGLPVIGRGMPFMGVRQAQHSLLVRNSSVSYTRH